MKRKIVHIVTTMNRGGLESLVMSLFRQMRSDFDFVFVVQKRGKHDYFDEIEKLGGQVVGIYRENFIDYLSYFIKMNQQLKRLNSEIIHSHIDTLSAIPLIIAKSNSYKIRIAHSHSSNQELNFYYPLKLLLKNLIRRHATVLVACSLEAGKWLYGKQSSFHYVPNGIDISRFRFKLEKRSIVRSEYGWQNNFVIGHIGRFNKVKNHNYLIQIFREVSKKREDAILVLIGNGPTKVRIQELVKYLNLIDKVVFLPSLNDTDKFYCGFDYFVFPSLFEGMSLAILEAQVSGLKCLLSNNITQESVFSNNSLCLDLSLSPRDWAEKIDFSFYDRSKESEELLKFSKKFDIKNTIDSFRNIYES